MSNEERIQQLEQHMLMVVESLTALSEANGASLDGLLALLPTLGPAGLLEMKEGKMPFMEALKNQHHQLHELNKVVAKLIRAYGIEGAEARLSPQPEADS